MFTGVTIFGTDAADTLDFSAVSLSGITLIDGGKGDDVIRGSATSNVIHGGAGMDTIEAGAGNDTIQFRGTALDVIDGGSGNDTVRAIADNASLIWSNVSHVERVDGTGYIGVKLLGTPAADALDFSAVTLLNVGLVDSGSGADAIVGSAGADVLKGGSGADGIAGGAGSDRFLYGATGESNPSEFDTISDFATGIDRIDLSAIDANTNSASHQSFSFIGAAAFNRTAGELRFDTGTAGVTRVLGDVDGNGAADMEIRLLGSHTLHASDFLGVV